MVYVIGTNHELQHHGTPQRADASVVEPARRNFQAYLRAQIEELDLQMIAEEQVREVLDTLDTTSTVEEVAKEYGLTHECVDLSSTERSNLGIPLGIEDCPPSEKAEHNRKREMSWYRKIQPWIPKCVLIVCGAEHVASFRALLEGEGTEVRTQCEYWGRDVYGT